jgi:hypothetical protein
MRAQTRALPPLAKRSVNDEDMWQPYVTESIGLLRQFSDSLEKYQRSVPGSVPEFRKASGIIVVSDYGGEHAGAEFDAYAFLITTPESVADWLPGRKIWRERMAVEHRRMAYKRLSDGIRQRACLPFLRIADLLNGMLISILIHKSITSLFATTHIDRTHPALARFGYIKPQVMEKLFRVLHLIGFFVGGLSAPGQDLTWISDEDAIMANPQRVADLKDLLAGVFSIYLRHDLGHVFCGTTDIDPGDLSVEDLAAIPDLVTGAAAEATSVFEAQGTMPPLTGVPVRIPDQVPVKAKPVLFWLSQPSEALSKLMFTIYPEPDGSGAIRILKHRYECREEKLG